jgi:hypothetical protein
MSSKRCIIERLLSGEEYDLRKIDEEIEAWHEADTDLQLHEWLGLTREEYALYIEKPASIRVILAARHQNVPLKQLMSAGTDKVLLAARGATATEIDDLRKWLSTTGRL